jgi:hypothetical protein
MGQSIFGTPVEFSFLLGGKLIVKIAKLQFNDFDEFASLRFRHSPQFFKDFGLAHAFKLQLRNSQASWI